MKRETDKKAAIFLSEQGSRNKQNLHKIWKLKKNKNIVRSTTHLLKILCFQKCKILNLETYFVCYVTCWFFSKWLLSPLRLTLICILSSGKAFRTNTQASLDACWCWWLLWSIHELKKSFLRKKNLFFWYAFCFSIFSLFSSLTTKKTVFSIKNSFFKLFCRGQESIWDNFGNSEKKTLSKADRMTEKWHLN